MKNSILALLMSHLIRRHLPSEESSNIFNNNSPTSLRAESILMEEFHRANIASYKSSDELSSSFNFYLIISGLIITSTLALETFFYQVEITQTSGVPITLDILAFIILIVGGFMGLFFLKRFVFISFEEFHSIYAMNNIKKFYIKQFEAELPIIKELLLPQNDTVYFIGIPSYIRYTVSFFSSSYFGGAVFLALGYVQNILDNGKIIIRFFEPLPELLLAIIISLAVILISFLLYQFYYKHCLNQKIATSKKDG